MLSLLFPSFSLFCHGMIPSVPFLYLRSHRQNESPLSFNLALSLSHSLTLAHTHTHTHPRPPTHTHTLATARERTVAAYMRHASVSFPSTEAKVNRSSISVSVSYSDPQSRTLSRNETSHSSWLPEQVVLSFWDQLLWSGVGDRRGHGFESSFFFLDTSGCICLLISGWRSVSLHGCLTRSWVRSQSFFFSTADRFYFVHS